MDDQGIRDKKAVHTIRDSCYHKEKGAEKTLGGGGERYDNSPTSKIYTTWASILNDHNVFCTLRGGGKTAGSNAPGAFLFFGGHLPRISARSKQYLPVIFVRLALFRQDFHKSW